ncbi:hypothetical protein [Nocardia sp. BMG51109]|uniref:hypothetical protein n=1 Tax=Nocardia sp. BMG51109 TaxID=1056816 RepID=UPI0004631B4D|nr:hypothetical protein [Nocardia sp. BMG51109]
MSPDIADDRGSPLDNLLPGPLPPSISALPADRHADLADLIRAAERARTTDLEQAAHRALDSIPVFLRPAVRKAVGL